MKKIFLIVALFALFLTGCGSKSNLVMLPDGQQATKIRGKIETIQTDIGMLVLDSKGKRTNISFVGGEELQDISMMDELKEGDILKVIYKKDDLGNYAVSIKKLPEGSCDG